MKPINQCMGFFSVCHFNFWLFYCSPIFKLYFSLSIFKLCSYHISYISISFISFPLHSLSFFNYKNHLTWIFHVSLQLALQDILAVSSCVSCSSHYFSKLPVFSSSCIEQHHISWGPSQYSSIISTCHYTEI
jgi:hypothetical protein